MTYGAGGSSQTLTEEMVVDIHREGDVLPMAHVSCVSKSKGELYALLDRLGRAGIKNIIALRGDAPTGTGKFTPVKDGFSHATELIQFIRTNFDFGVAAACYPEGHVESPDLTADMEDTRKKLDAGADFLITQLFYDNRHYFDFVDRARKMGISAPILAGILPILNVSQVRRFTSHCGVRIPPYVDKRLSRIETDDEAVKDFGVGLATKQVQELWDNGVDGIHFYALNRSQSISRILDNLGDLDFNRSHRLRI